MVRTSGCDDCTCKYGDGTVCHTDNNHETITINNKSYNVCVTYEDKREGNNNESSKNTD